MNLKTSKIAHGHKRVAEKLRENTDQLVSNFLKGKELSFLEPYSRVLDNYFQESFEMSRLGPRITLNKNLYAIIALGGYGRQEQCIYSDIDLLFLFEKKVPEETEALIREIIYPLWDMGLDVGYATRSIRESVHLALEEIEVLTSLLDARFICGMSPLYSALMEKLGQKITTRRSNKIIAALIENNRRRHRYYGDSAYLLEPNLKEGQGGLRDYHTMLWIARIKSNLRQFRDFEYHGYLSHDELDSLRNSLRFIWNIRNRLHHLTGRKCDQLYFEHQAALATSLNFREEKEKVDALDLSSFTYNDGIFNLDPYDLICIGVPTWGMRPAFIFDAYIKKCTSFEGKTVVVFCTCRLYGGSTVKKMKAEIEKKGGNVIQKKSFRALFKMHDKKAREFGKILNQN